MGIMGSGCAFNKGYRSTTDGRMAPLTLKACFILQPGVLKPPYYHILIYIVTYYSYYSICHMCCLNSDVSQKEALKDSEFSILCKKDELTRVIVITYYYIKSLAPCDRKSVLKLPGGLSPSKTQPSPPTNFHRRLIQHDLNASTNISSNTSTTATRTTGAQLKPPSGWKTPRDASLQPPPC